ncbi:MAG: glycosyltransferase family 9 protein [Fibrobacteria bacterium]
MSLSRKFNLALKSLLGKWLVRSNPVKIDLAQCRRVLVLELWGLGDVVFAAPAIKALLAQDPNRSVDLLAQPSSKPLLELMGLGLTPVFFKFPWTQFDNKYNPVHYLRPSFWRLIRRLRANHYDLILSVREDPRDALLARLIAPRHSLGYAAFGSHLFLSSSIPAMRSHKTDAWFRLLAFLGITQEAKRAFLELRGEIKGRLPASASSAGKRIVLHCSARNPVRDWGLPHFVELGRLLERDPAGYEIQWLSDSNSPATNAVPGHWRKLSGNLAEILAIIASSGLYIGNDGGMMHMADLFGAKICAVFGPTDPGTFFPYGQPDSLVFLPEVACRPCFDYCIYPKPICFNGITPADMHRKALELLHVGS